MLFERKPRSLLLINAKNIEHLISKAWSRVSKTGPASRLNLELDAKSQSSIIKYDNLPILKIHYELIGREIIFSNLDIELLHNHRYYAKHQITTSIKSIDEIEKQIFDRFTLFLEFISDFLTYLETYGNTAILSSRIKEVLSKNWDIPVEDFEEGFAGGFLKKNGATFQQYTVRSSMDPNSLKVNIENFKTSAVIIIEDQNSKLATFLVAQGGNPLANLEKYIKKMFVSRDATKQIKMDDLLGIINESIGSCSHFTRNVFEGKHPSIYNFSFQKKEEEIYLGEDFRKRDRRLGEDDCSIHLGTFIAFPLNLQNFNYIHLAYKISSGNYINENLIVIGPKDEVVPKVRAFVKDIVDSLDIYQGVYAGAPRDDTKKSVKYREMLQIIINLFEEKACNFEPNDAPDPNFEMYCTKYSETNKVIVIKLKPFQENGKLNMVIEFEPNSRSQKSQFPKESYILHESQSTNSFEIIKRKIRDHISTF